MQAANEMSVSRMASGTLEASMDAELVELCRNITARTIRPSRREDRPLTNCGVFRVYPQPYDMQGLAAPINRDFHTIYEGDIFHDSGLPRLFQSSYVIVVG